MQNSPETTADSTPLKSERGISIFSVFVYFLICVMVAGSMLITYDRYFAQKFLYVDVKAFLDDQTLQVLQNKITEEQLQQNIVNMHASVDRLPKNYIVILNLPSANNIADMSNIALRNAQSFEPR